MDRTILDEETTIAPMGWSGFFNFPKHIQEFQHESKENQRRRASGKGNQAGC